MYLIFEIIGVFFFWIYTNLKQFFVKTEKRRYYSLPELPDGPYQTIGFVIFFGIISIFLFKISGYFTLLRVLDAIFNK